MNRFLGCVLSLLCFSVYSQDLYEKYEKVVNPLNGKFNFSETLITLNSASGPSQNISASYTGDVKTNQRASNIGLGWSLNTGEITRELIGFPDEKSTFSQTQLKILNDLVVENEVTIGTGPMAFLSYQSSAASTMDLLVSKTKTGPQAISPAFDNFIANGMGINGVFSLSGVIQDDPIIRPYESIYPKDFEADLRLKPFETKNNQDEDVTFNPQDVTDVEILNFSEFSMENDPVQNNYIEYYFNNDLSNKNYINHGFLEYFDADGISLDRTVLNSALNNDIGAFTIYTSNGLKYHYSLPVITLRERSYYYPVENGAVLSSASDTVLCLKNLNSYVSSWKLTAITGANYSDDNSNGYPDDGDSGYWVRFNYSKWHNRNERAPYFGYIIGNKPLTNDVDFINRTHKSYSGNVTYSEKTEYYLESIETDLEKVIFYKGVRDDNYAFSDFFNAFALKIPALKMEKIVKFSKVNLINLNQQTPSSLNSKFKPLASNGIEYNHYKTFFLSDYIGNEGKILSSVEFDFTYDLQGNYDGNISKFPSVANYLVGPNYNNIISVLSRPQTSINSGKLTLSKIKLNGENDIHSGEYNFGYNTNNPNHSPNNFDQYGYYVDLQELPQLRNRNLNSQLNFKSDCWLLNKIEFPNEVILEVDYEENLFTQFHSEASHETGWEYLSLDLVSLDTYNADYANSSSGITTFTSTITAKFQNPEDLKIILNNSGINRDVKLRGKLGVKYYQQTGSTVKKDICISLNSSLNNINNLGVGTGGTLTVNSYNIATGTINLTAECSYGDSASVENWSLADYTSSNVHVYSSPKFYHLAIAYSNEVQRAGSSHVKETRIKESNGASNFAKYEYKYSLPVMTFNNQESYFAKDGNGYSIYYGNKNTPFNSYTFGIAFGKTKVLKYGENSFFHSSTIFQHSVSSPLRFVAQPPARQQKCFVPQVFLNLSPRSLYTLMYEDKSSKEYIPGLLQASLNRYLVDIFIPQNGNFITGINDSAKISQRLPTTPIHDMIGTMRSTGYQAFLTKDATVSNYGTIVTAVNPYGPPPYQIRFFSEGTSSPNLPTSKSYITAHDRSQFFGLLLKMEVRDRDSNTVIINEYEYDTKAVYHAKYMSNMINEDFHTVKFSTDYFKYYPYPKRKLINQDGSIKVEHIYNLNAKNGLTSEIAVHSKDENILTTKTFTNLDLDLVKYWPKSKRIISEKLKRIVEDESYDFNMINTVSKHYPLLESASLTERYENHEDYFNQLYHYSRIPVNAIPFQSIITNLNYKYLVKQRILINGEFENVQINPYSTLDIPIVGHTTTTNDVAHLLNENKINLIDSKDRILETTSVKNDVFSSMKYLQSQNQPFIISEALQYDLYTASSFEDPDLATGLNEGEVKLASNVILESETYKAHTGKQFLRIPSSGNFNELYRDKKMENFGKEGLYIFQIWVRSNNISGTPEMKVTIYGESASTPPLLIGPAIGITKFTTSNATNSITLGDWTLLTIEIELPSGFFVPTSPYEGVGNTSYFGGLTVSVRNAGGNFDGDDFRFFPANAPISYDVFNLETGQISAKLNALNHATLFEYDHKGRETRILKETTGGFVLISQTNYND